jgi:endonuclease/exonuclease/phosphatase family metal-dependent hydrolase
MREGPAVILGDLNIPPLPARRGIGACFRKILDSGWKRAGPDVGYSYVSQSGARSEIDHALVTQRCTVRGAKYVTCLPGFNFAGTPDALSDHAALVVVIDIH